MVHFGLALLFAIAFVIWGYSEIQFVRIVAFVLMFFNHLPALIIG